MQIFDRAQLIQLIETDPPIAVSIFMPGSGGGGTQARQDPIRLKNLLNTAEDQLKALDVNSLLIGEILQPARERLDSTDFWRDEGGKSLAIFLAPGFAQFYRVNIDVEEGLHVDTRFRVRPLLPLLAQQEHYYVLAISENSRRLILCQDDKAGEVELPGAPATLNDYMKLEDREQQLQMHSTGSPQSGQASGAFHGSSGSWNDYEKANIPGYMKALDAAVYLALATDRAPLVLAGVEAVCAAYRNVSRYPGLLETELHGNFDDISAEQLRKQSWPLVEDKLRDINGKRERIETVLGTGRSSVDPREIVQAAINGRIDTLFMDPSAELHGSFDPSTQNVNPHDPPRDGDVDLIELAAEHTLRNAGVVLVPAELPGSAPMSALMRWQQAAGG